MPYGMIWIPKKDDSPRNFGENFEKTLRKCLLKKMAPNVRLPLNKEK